MATTATPTPAVRRARASWDVAVHPQERDLNAPRVLKHEHDENHQRDRAETDAKPSGADAGAARLDPRERGRGAVGSGGSRGGASADSGAASCGGNSSAVAPLRRVAPRPDGPIRFGRGTNTAAPWCRPVWLAPRACDVSIPEYFHRTPVRSASATFRPTNLMEPPAQTVSPRFRSIVDESRRHLDHGLRSPRQPAPIAGRTRSMISWRPISRAELRHPLDGHPAARTTR